MVNYEDDEAIAELQDEMYRKEEERPAKPKIDLGSNTKMIVGIGIAALLFFYFNEKITTNQLAMAVLAGAVILYFMNSSNDSKREELTYIECMIRLNDLLKFLQSHPIGDVPQIPKGDVSINPIGRKQWFEGQGFKRSYGVEIYDAELQITENYFVEVDIFTGDIITFKAQPEGVYGDETKDIKLMPSYDMIVQKKRDKFMGKGFK